MDERSKTGCDEDPNILIPHSSNSVLERSRSTRSTTFQCFQWIAREEPGHLSPMKCLHSNSATPIGLRYLY
ncbi:unnamed protein product, partial [Mesorhabditis belari]|uniref:Uncharacterized protein n=1 Tax=Mesorhabditis belari TaxID=2138241 RepID=A0AAF3FAN4_9BILA